MYSLLRLGTNGLKNAKLEYYTLVPLTKLKFALRKEWSVRYLCNETFKLSKAIFLVHGKTE